MAVAEERHFTRAAARMHVARSGPFRVDPLP
ncbi:LysR family transcriptional regulator [Micromonospora sp. NBC_00858]|nr:LysR family transcriptional regulator [Micromonospora sp. NBC_00858]